jgi:hypothetical protein
VNPLACMRGGAPIGGTGVRGKERRRTHSKVAWRLRTISDQHEDGGSQPAGVRLGSVVARTLAAGVAWAPMVGRGKAARAAERAATGPVVTAAKPGSYGQPSGGETTGVDPGLDLAATAAMARAQRCARWRRQQAGGPASLLALGCGRKRPQSQPQDEPDGKTTPHLAPVVDERLRIAHRAVRGRVSSYWPGVSGNFAD